MTKVKAELMTQATENVGKSDSGFYTIAYFPEKYEKVRILAHDGITGAYQWADLYEKNRIPYEIMQGKTCVYSDLMGMSREVVIFLLMSEMVKLLNRTFQGS